MKSINVFKITVFALIILTVCIATFADSRFEEISCMEVRVLTDESQVVCREETDMDLSGYFFFKNEPAAVDRESRTIYISQNISDDTRYQDLEGNLALAYGDFQLYFAPDPYFNHLKSAAGENHCFRLLAVDPEGNYGVYNVVFTSLPVLNLTEQSSFDDGARSFGTFCLWAPNDPNALRYSISTGFSEWKVRGNTTASMPKKSWKLSLKSSKHEISEHSLLGLGKDDDWILNALYLDDTNLKEPLFMELWNQMAIDTAYNYPMSSGEYVEVVINQEYQGIYLLQRRIDNKYLSLPSDCILFKGINNAQQETVQETYEIIYSPFDTEDSYALLDGIWNKDYSMYDIDNFVDVNLFLHFASATDNAVHPKNMFYVFSPASSGYTVSLIPWDTDMSFGVVWNDCFAYDYEKSMNLVARRLEFDAIMLAFHPQLWDRMAARWQELRQDVLSEKNILSVLSGLEASLLENGASARESQRWGEYYGGSDTVENLYRYIREKLPLMDAFYTQ